MFRLRLIILLSVLGCPSWAQIGINSSDTLLWQQTIAWGYPGGGGNPVYSYTYTNHAMRGDSVVNGTTYKKLYSHSSTSSPAFYPSLLMFDSFLRSDSCCVYRGDATVMEKIQDYSLLPGDSFKFPGYSPKLKLLTIDSQLINGAYQKRFNFQNNIKWIRGIGDVVYGHFWGYNFLLPWSGGQSPPFATAIFRCYSEQNGFSYGNYCLVNGLYDIEKDENKILVYPNPCSEVINVSCLDATEFILVDVLGKKVLSVTENRINVGNLPNGIFFLKALTSSGNLTKKIIIQH